MRIGNVILITKLVMASPCVQCWHKVLILVVVYDEVDLASSFRLLRMMAERERMAVVWSCICSFLMVVGGNLKQLVRFVWFRVCTPPLCPAVMTRSG